MRRWLAVLLPLVLLLALAGTVVLAGPAAAHAQLVGTDPGDGARLDRAPATIGLTFAETVLLRPTSIQVQNSAAENVQVGTAFHPDDVGRLVAVRLRADLPDGSYTVRYGIVSPDGHPVSGAFAFVIGTGPLVGVNGVPTGGAGADPLVSGLYGLGRWVSYGGLAVLGGLVFIATCWPAGAGSARARRWLRRGWLATVIGTVTSFLLLGPYGSGRGLGDALSPALIGTTVSLPVGRVLLVRLAALAVLIPVAARVLRSVEAAEDVRRAAQTMALVVTVPLLIGFSGSGHAESGAQPTAVVLSDLVHVAAMAVWLGGVVMLLGVALPEADSEDLARLLPVFSRIAFGAICVLVATGCFQAWQQVASVPRLWETDYGRVLSIKVLAVLVVVLAGNRSRRAVQRLQADRTGAAPALSRVGAPPAPGPGTGFDAGTGFDSGPIPGAQSGFGADREPVVRAAASVPGLARALVVEVAVSALVLLLSATLVAIEPARLATPHAPSSDVGPRASVPDRSP